ncbi:hypothetical protein ACGF1Z_31335 [Streptomyces sp. NPDC048018]|uniref:hypothetical protein n=1 Tax=Streptomyces sp. NPDC048018 TaxID=3365499 RepID=UPI00371D7949
MYPTLIRTPGLARFTAHVDDERQAQLAKFGDQHHPDGTGAKYYVGMADQAREDTENAAESVNGPRWSLILLEEVYQALAEADPARLRAELVQVAAVCAAWARDIDSRPHPMVCAHCGEQIETSEIRNTWSGPLKVPGVPECASPRYHIDRPECRAASGRACDEQKAAHQARTAVRTPDPAVRAGQDDAS